MPKVQANLQSPLWPPPTKETVKEGTRWVSGDLPLLARALALRLQIFLETESEKHMLALSEYTLVPRVWQFI